MSTAPAPPTRSPSGPALPLTAHGVPTWIPRVMMFNLICEIGIVVTGGLVRVTDSGLGCPTWPNCVPGSFIPVAHQAQGFHKYIEYGNRSLITVLVVAGGAALWAAIVYRRTTGAGRLFVWWGTAPLWGIVAQAIIGGIAVRTKLSPISVAFHFLPSMVIISVSLLLYLAVRDRALAPERGRELRWLTAAVAVLTAVIIAMGTVVTGSGPYSGDANVHDRFPFDPRDVTWLHSDAVLLFTGLVVGLVLVARISTVGPVVRRRSGWLLGVTCLQAVVGYIDYAARLPMYLVVVHMLGAALLVVAVTAVAAGVTGVRGLLGAAAEAREP